MVTILSVIYGYGAAVCGLGCSAEPLSAPVDVGREDRGNPAVSVLGPACLACTRVALGAPPWEPARALLFSGNVGPSGELRNTLLQTVLAPRHKYYSEEQQFGPAEAHPPPYDDEIYDLLAARGVTPSQTFDDVQFNAPQAVMMLMTLVPSGVTGFTGGSFDFPSGPIIPDYLMPIQVDVDLYRDGQLLDAALDSRTIGAGQFDPPITVSGSDPAIGADGASHLIVGAGDNSSLANAPYLPPDGNYEYQVTMLDGRGSGWTVRIPFKVGQPGSPTPS